MFEFIKMAQTSSKFYIFHFKRDSVIFNSQTVINADLDYIIRVMAMAIPAAIMDSAINKRIDKLEDRVKYLEDWVRYFIMLDKQIKAENMADLNKHVEALERRVQLLEKK